MKIILKVALLSICVLLCSCSFMNIYRNASDPVDRRGKENWALMSVDAGEVGSILISPRSRENAAKAMLSAGNHLARKQILLEKGIRDINVYAFNRSKNAVFVISDIKIEENGDYLVKYEFQGNEIKTWIIDKKTGEKIK